MEIFKTKNKSHGNVKVVVSDPLLRILRPGKELQRGEKFSHVQIVKGLWNYINIKGVYSPGSDYFATDESINRDLPFGASSVFRIDETFPAPCLPQWAQHLFRISYGNSTQISTKNKL